MHILTYGLVEVRVNLDETSAANHSEEQNLGN